MKPTLVIPIALIYHAAFEEENPKVNVLVMENLKDQGYKPLRPETCGLVYMRAAMTRSDKLNFFQGMQQKDLTDRLGGKEAWRPTPFS